MAKGKKRKDGSNTKFRGRWSATIDSKGRMKIPVKFRETLLNEFGSEVFITTIQGENLIIYPLSIWTEVEESISKHTSKHVRRYRRLANYSGQVVQLDSQGRVLIPSSLRTQAKLSGEVDVVGEIRIITVWNPGVLKSKIKADRQALDEDVDELSIFEI